MIGQMIRNIGALTNTIATITATQSNRSTRITFQLNTGRFFGTYSMTFGGGLLIDNLIPDGPASGPRERGSVRRSFGTLCQVVFTNWSNRSSRLAGPLKPRDHP